MFPSKVDWPVKNSMLKCKHVKQDTHGCTVEEANATSSDRHICQDFTLSIVSGHGPVTMPYVCMYISTYVRMGSFNGNVVQALVILRWLGCLGHLA